MTDPDHLRTYFLAFGRALNIARLEERLELPTRTIRHWLKGEQGLPNRHLDKVAGWARWFGYQENRQYDQFL